MSNMHRKILFYKISQFNNKYKGLNHHTFNDVLKDFNIKIGTYEGTDYLNLLRLSEDGFSVMKNNEFYIFYNPYMPAKRKRFTIAHELGHVVLNHHRLSRRNVLAKSNKDDFFEKQANIFARNILMPVDDVLDYVDTKSTQELADIFDVSYTMAKIRMQYLRDDYRWVKFFTQT